MAKFDKQSLCQNSFFGMTLAKVILMNTHNMFVMEKYVKVSLHYYQIATLYLVSRLFNPMTWSLTVKETRRVFGDNQRKIFVSSP